MNNHSPGPWEACDNDGHSLWHIYSTSVNVPIVAAVYGDCAETEENARLIAAAPDMLRVLRMVHASSKWSLRDNDADFIREIIERIDGKEAQ